MGMLDQMINVRYILIFFLSIRFLNPNFSYGESIFKYQWVSIFDVPSSIRSIAFAKVFTPISDDSLSFDHNPAGLSYVRYSYVNSSFLKPKKNNFNLYMWLVSYNLPEVKERPYSIAFANKLIFLDNEEKIANTFYFSFSKQFLDKISIGFNFHFFYSQFVNKQDFYVPGLDFGIMTSAIPFVRIGLMLKDLISIKIHPQSQSQAVEKVPTIIKVGFASDFSKYWTIAFQIDKNLDNKDSGIFYGFSTYFLLWEQKDIPYKNELLFKKEAIYIPDEETEDFEKDNLMDQEAPLKIFNTRLFLNAGFNSDQELGIGITANIYLFKIDLSLLIKEVNIDNIYLGFNIGVLLP